MPSAGTACNLRLSLAVRPRLCPNSCSQVKLLSSDAQVGFCRGPALSTQVRDQPGPAVLGPPAMAKHEGQIAAAIEQYGALG